MTMVPLPAQGDGARLSPTPDVATRDQDDRDTFVGHLWLMHAGAWNIDMSRFSLENLPPIDYLGSSYYRKWFLGLERRLVALGFVAPDEVAAGHAKHPAKALKRGNFTSLDDLRDQILAFIAYYNRTMAKPIKWTYTGLA